MRVNICCLTDSANVLYNKFNVSSSSPPDNPPQHPNSDYSCVVATTGQWRVSRCDQQHHVVCQRSPPGIIATCSAFTVTPSFASSGFLICARHFVHTSCNSMHLAMILYCSLILFTIHCTWSQNETSLHSHIIITCNSAALQLLLATP